MGGQSSGAKGAKTPAAPSYGGKSKSAGSPPNYGAMGSNMANMAKQGAMGSSMANMAKQYAPQIGQMASTMAQRAPGIMNAALGNPVIDPARQAARQEFKANYGQDVNADNRQQFRQDFRQHYNPQAPAPQAMPPQSLPAEAASTALMAGGVPWRPFTSEDKINSEQRTQDAAAKLGGALGLQDPRYMEMINGMEAQGPNYAGGRAMPTWTPPWMSGR